MKHSNILVQLQKIIGVYGFLSNVNESSVNVFITTISSNVAEVSSCTIKYFSEASVLYMFLTFYIRRMGYAVAQLVEALRYKPEGRGFDSRWCHWNFSLT